ncbi:MAG: hypothetical protein GC160_10345 [Acidobacteria bacterium]|nr:hypothetical protein [Acidobacteriota bacterium]
MTARIPFLLVAAFLSATPLAAQTFSETFDGGHSPTAPGPPLPWNSADWDVQTHVRSAQEKLGALDPHDADHGPACEAPGEDGSVTHPVERIEDAVYQCANHVMTSFRADDYGLIALTPPALADFSQGEATIEFDISSWSDSARDWFGVVLQPFDDQLPLPVVEWLPDLNGFGRRALHFDFGGGVICPVVYRDFEAAEGGDKFAGDCRWWDSWDGYFEPSAMARRTIRITVSRTRVRVEMPEVGLVWADMSVADLGWDQAVVSLVHHSYTPFKDGNGGPNTWHWDDVSIEPARPLTILQAQRRWANADGEAFVFPSGAPAGAMLRGSAIGTRLELSFDAGLSWQTAARQPSQKDSPVWQFLHPVPTGAREVRVRSGGVYPDWWSGGWIAKDLSLLAVEPPRGIRPSRSRRRSR